MIAKSCFVMKLYNTLLLFSIFLHVTCHRRILNLAEGDICQKCSRSNFDYVCKFPENCETLVGNIQKNGYPDICSFAGLKPIICCPSQSTDSNFQNQIRANQMCRRYSELTDIDSDEELFKFPSENEEAQPFIVVGGTYVGPEEFPHMAILGYGDTTSENKWGCGGSLISERWILTAAHCEKMSSSYAQWVRLGDINIMSLTHKAVRTDYRIVERVIHPDYKPPSLYNDIALFRLEQDVQYSKFVRPICLNTDPSFVPIRPIATGWGRTSTDGPTSPDLLKVELSIFSHEQCNNTYFTKSSKQMQFGILKESMICAGSTDGDKDTCTGDSGGPLQVINSDNSLMYIQIGVTSFGRFCAEKDVPAVYTRVSNYISWIENIVWPVTEIDQKC